MTKYPSKTGDLCLVFSISIICFLCSLRPAWSQETPVPHLTEQVVKSEISNLVEMKFHPGQNTEYFSGIDQDGSISVNYMNYGDTGSHDLFIVTTDDNNFKFSIIPINDNEFIEDAPFDNEMVQRTVRFFNGMFNGTPETILYVSTLNHPTPISTGGSTALISVYFLFSVHDFPEFQFKKICEFITSQKFYNADQALKTSLNVSMP